MLPYLQIAGSSFDVGLALGRFGAAAMQDHVIRTDAWAQIMRWRGASTVAAMRGMVEKCHPRIWQELVGMAAGLALPVEDVFLWNCRGDLWALAPDGCTTVQLPSGGTDGFPRIAHNEDGDPGLAGKCALVEIDVEGGARFASFIYPGSLPGHTIAVNAQGLVMTVNNLRLLQAMPGVPRMILARAILDLADVSSALAFLRQSMRSGGFHFTLAQAGLRELTSVEFNDSQCSAVAVSVASLHANHMIHPLMNHQPQIITGSSGRRQIRGNLLLEDAAMEGRQPDPLEILFDRQDSRFPIYRDQPNDSDNENTMITAMIEVRADAVVWEVYCGPQGGPAYRMRNAARS